METLRQYGDLRPVPGQHRARVMRARRRHDGRAVVLKQAAPGDGPRLEREARALLLCEGPGLVPVVEFDAQAMVLAMEDLGDSSLASLLAQGPIPAPRAIVLALRVCEAIGRLHAHDILHLDLSPRNVRLAEQSDWPTLIGLDCAQRVGPIPQGHATAGERRWRCPEHQSGGPRIGDPRSDVYGVAQLLWALLEGGAPFPEGRSAQQPLPESTQVQDPALLALLRSALSLHIEARPESLRALQRALAELLPVPSGPQIQGIYGQHDARAIAAQALGAADRGDSATLLIEGEAGSGKSKLLASLTGLPAGRRGLLAWGQGRSVAGEGPYAPWTQALRSALGQITRLPSHEQAALRARLTDALGQDGGMLRRMLPELEGFVGPQPQGRPTAPSEIEQVLNRLVRRLLEALARPGAPLILALDDAHNLDPASARLLEALALTSPVPGLLLILSWRSEALGPGHPLPHTLEALQSLQPQLIQMTPLGRAELLDLCQESLGLDLGSARALAELLMQASEGIPARLHRTLHHLHRQELLRYDPLQGAWTWDVSRMARLDLRMDPQALVEEAFALLPSPVREALSELAVMGQQGHLAQAFALLPAFQTLTEADLAPACAAGLLELRAGHWRLCDAELQQAALSRMTPEAQRTLHGQLAEAYLSDQDGGRFFAGVDHLNLGAAPREAEEARSRRAELNVEAARRALLGSAFGASLAYTTQALSALPKNWDRRRRLALHREAASAAHLSGDQTRAEQLLGRAAEHAHSPLERASLAEIQVTTLLSSAQHGRARTAALEGLSHFGLAFEPGARAPTPPQLEQLPRQQANRNLVGLGRNALLARTLLVGVASDPELADWAAARLAQLSRAEGPTVHSALAVAWIGLQIGRSRAPHLAARLAQTAEQLLTLFEAPQWQALTLSFTAARIHAQVLPPEQALERVEAANALCQSSGQRHAEAELGVARAWLSLRAGKPLQEIEARCEQDMALARRTRSRACQDQLALLRQLTRALQGKTRPGRLDEPGFDEGALLASEHTDAQTRGMVDAASLWLAVLDDNALSARIRADSASEAWAWLGAGACTPLLRCLRGIARLMGKPGPNSQEAAAADLRWLEGAGFEAPAAVLRAELLRAQGEELSAISHFDEALLRAEREGPAWLSLATLRGAAFHGQAGRGRIAETYQSSGREILLRWSGHREHHEDQRSGPSFGGVVAVADALASEGEGRLSERLLRACVQAVGADRGVLVQDRPGGPVLQAWGAAQIESMEEEPLSASSPVSITALNLAHQMGELVRWEEVGQASDLAKDPWCARGDVRSLLAAPLLHQGQRLGTILMENHQQSAVFSAERARVMALLAVQVASALGQRRSIEALQATIARQARELELNRTRDQRYRDLFEAAPDPIFLTDTSGRVSDANAAAHQWLGERELVGHGLSTLLGDPRLLDHANVQLRREGRLGSLRLSLPNGESRSVSATWLWSEDLASGTTQWVFRDVQELVDAAAELEQRVYERTAQLSRSNMELEASNAELRQFATLASHDLKSPIRTVSNYLSLLRRRHGAELSEAGQTTLNKAIAGSVRMQALIDDMLSLAQVGQDRRPFARVDLNEAVAEALDNLDSELSAAGGRVFVQSLPLVSGNALRLSQLLQNLIGNAIKYARPQIPPLIRVEAETQGGLLLVRVRDNGIGVPPESQRAVFDIFKRLHKRQAFSGNGIGLAIARKIVEMHGGAIWMDQQDDPGTCVCFTLPLADAP